MTENTILERFAFQQSNECNVKDSTMINLRASLVPAAAVIPAQEAYIKFVAVKKLVVEFLVDWTRTLAEWPLYSLCPVSHLCWVLLCPASFTVKKMECSKQLVVIEQSVWNNKKGRLFYFVGLQAAVMIKRNSWGYSYLHARGEILGLCKDEQLRKHLPRMFSLIKNERQGIEDD